MLVSMRNVHAQNIPLTFHNGSFKFIYLSIPGVMNPNLLPKSNSGLSLDVGQLVYFFPKGKNRKEEVLFVVEPSLKKGTVLEIDEIIRKRKKELRIN